MQSMSGSTLFKKAMKNLWKEVISEYADSDDAHLAKITSSGDTALHVAIAHGPEDSVHNLIEAIKAKHGDSGLKAALRIENSEGNTPLHVAAALGNVSMCEEMALSDPDLVTVRNKQGETPLFMAVQQGNKEAFLCLHSICGFERSQACCTRLSDGETILHCAIVAANF
ncbi:Transmembrane protein, partial [Parasponia andersonii]